MSTTSLKKKSIQTQLASTACESVAQSFVKSLGMSKDTSLLTTNRGEEVRVEAERRLERDTKGR